jgi:hypothetical protein
VPDLGPLTRSRPIPRQTCIAPDLSPYRAKSRLPLRQVAVLFALTPIVPYLCPHRARSRPLLRQISATIAPGLCPYRARSRPLSRQISALTVPGLSPYRTRSRPVSRQIVSDLLSASTKPDAIGAEILGGGGGSQPHLRFAPSSLGHPSPLPAFLVGKGGQLVAKGCGAGGPSLSCPLPLFQNAGVGGELHSQDAIASCELWLWLWLTVAAVRTATAEAAAASSRAAATAFSARSRVH